MRRPAGRREHDLRPAALSALQVKRRGLADHDQVGSRLLHHFGQAQPFERFLAYRPGHVHRSREPVAASRQGSQAADHRGQRAFHVAGAAAVDTPVPHDPAEGVHAPFPGVRHADGVDMSVEQDRRSRQCAADFADHVAVPVDPGPAVAQFQHRFAHFFRHPALAACRTGQPDQTPAQFQQYLPVRCRCQPFRLPLRHYDALPVLFRRTCPDRAPVSSPRFTAATPLTKTYSIPSG